MLVCLALIPLTLGQTIWSNKFHSQFVTQLCMSSSPANSGCTSTGASRGTRSGGGSRVGSNEICRNTNKMEPSLVSCSRDGNICYWDVSNGNVIRSLDQPTSVCCYYCCRRRYYLFVLLLVCIVPNSCMGHVYMCVCITGGYF